MNVGPEWKTSISLASRTQRQHPAPAHLMRSCAVWTVVSHKHLFFYHEENAVTNYFSVVGRGHLS